MKYVVDRKEDKIVILENLETGEKIEVEEELFDFDVNDGMVVVYEDDHYVLDKKESKNRNKEISNLFNKLKKKKK